MKSPLIRLGAPLAIGLTLGACMQPVAESLPSRALGYPATTTNTAPVAAAAPEVNATAPARPIGSAHARNAFVLLSGGGTPLSNNYSQYLQARAVAEFFARRYPSDPSWVFFGAGNRPGEAPVLADARQQLKRNGLLVESWVPGLLPHNRPATRESFLQALREEILPTVREGGTLFLFVGDHGTLSQGAKPESVVTMWQLKQNAPGSAAWSTDNKQELSVSDLRAALAEGLGQGRVVFCMTQCHSGGFHYLGVPREIATPAAWLVHASAGPARPAPLPLLRVAGFTATDEESLAAGCDPDPDPDKWAGYERFMPESMLGLDLFTLEPTGTALPSFAAAHEAATLMDRTIDKPRATSEQLLERWAQTIEKAAENPQDLSASAARAMQAFTQAVDTGHIQSANPRVREKSAEFARFTSRLIEQDASLRTLLLSGTRKQLEEAIGLAASRPGASGARGGRGGRVASAEARTGWRDVVRPAWKAAVLAGEVKTLPAAALDFEKRLLTLEDGGRDFMMPTGGGNPMLNEIYWRSGYAFPDKLDRAKAEAVTQWAVERRSTIAEWAKTSGDSKIRVAGDAMGGGGARRQIAATPASGPGRNNVSTRPLSRKTAAERVLFYRRTLAAWECLVALNERGALDQLQAFIELERTPLPVPTR